MERQLALLEPPPSWHLSEHTREIGRRGIASARAALAEAAGEAQSHDEQQDRSAA